MVHQLTNNSLIDVRVCSLSLQRHETAGLAKQRRYLPKHIKAKMGDGAGRKHLPLVELQPFSKKVWRREKSLPDFYDKKQAEEGNNLGSKEKPPEMPAATAKLMRELEESRRSLETRHGALEPCIAKFRSHPKAEFFHEFTNIWRSNDLIPSFITRLERTKSTFDSLQKDPLSPSKLLPEEYSPRSEPLQDGKIDNSYIKVNGGRIHQRLYKRQLLYLNPIDSYRQPDVWAPNIKSHSTGLSRHPTREKSVLSRNTFPLSSGVSKHLVLSGSSRVNYPLRPIQREHTQSPHKFNSKLGAAKNSMDILSKWGVPTKLEKNLEKEFEMNLERFRRDRTILSNDVKNMAAHYVTYDNNPTPGELSLRQAREANRARGRRSMTLQLASLSQTGGMPDGRDSGIQSPGDVEESGNNGTPRLEDTYVNVLMHPIDQVLPEESESHDVTDANIDDVDNEKIALPVISTSNELSSHAQECHATAGDILAANMAVSKSEAGEVEARSSMNGRVSHHTEESLRASEGSRSAGPNEHLATEGLRPVSDILSHTTDMPAELTDRSPTSRSKTTLEYLHNLRKTGGLPVSLQVSVHVGVTDIPTEPDVRLSGTLRREGDVHRQHSASEKENSPKLRDLQHGHVSSNSLEISRSVPSTESATEEVVLRNKNFESSGHCSQYEENNVLNTDNPSLPPIKNNDSNNNSINNKFHNNNSRYNNTNNNHINYMTESKNNVNMKDTCSISESTNVPLSQAHEEEKNGNIIRSSKMATKPCDDTIIPLNAEHVCSQEDETSDSRRPVKPSKTCPEQCFPGIEPVGDTAQMMEDVAYTRSAPFQVDPAGPHPDDVESGAESRGGSSLPPISVERTLVEEDCAGTPSQAMDTTMLDSSMTEPLSDAEGGNLSNSADNGDSGISTTFLTADDSRPTELEGLLF